jgi:hypothetical protein
MSSSLQLRTASLAAAIFLLTDGIESFSQARIGGHASCPSKTALLAREALETEETKIRDQILEQIDSGLRDMTGYEEYLETAEELFDEDDDDDAIDAADLGQWDERDFQDKFEYEWDPSKGEQDPNTPDPGFEYLESTEVDEEGIEVGYNPMYGVSNPFDERTIINPPDSYVIDEKTRDDRMVTPEFLEDDPEKDINQEITSFRKSLKMIETHVDPFLKQEVPSHTAKWHGYPEQLSFPKQDYFNNRFTKPEDRTDFNSMEPSKARIVAVQTARKKNNEWLPEGLSAAYHEKKFAVFKKNGILTGSTLPGEKDPEIVAKIRPALEVLGDCVELLSIECETVFRFKYHGLIKNKRGMQAWTAKLIRNCDVDCTGVVFETGFRKRDPWYDGGNHWYGPY